MYPHEKWCMLSGMLHAKQNLSFIVPPLFFAVWVNSFPRRALGATRPEGVEESCSLDDYFTIFHWEDGLDNFYIFQMLCVWQITPIFRVMTMSKWDKIVRVNGMLIIGWNLQTGKKTWRSEVTHAYYCLKSSYMPMRTKCTVLWKLHFKPSALIKYKLFQSC